MGALTSTSPLPESHALHGRRILVCLDGSPFAEVCVPHAVALAKIFGSAVTLVHVMRRPHDHVGPQTSDALGWEISRQEARAYLERMEGEAERALGQPVEVRLEQGHPAERIVGLAREIGADLTVLGSHGEGGVTHWNLGSTVQQVLAVTRGSVLVARSAAPAPPVVSLEAILVPLDGSPRTESVLPTAGRIASAHGAELLLVHVVHEPSPTALLYSAEDLVLARTLAGRVEAGARRYLEHLGQQLGHDGASVRTRVVRHANEHHCLLEISRKEHIDLVVLSAHGATCDSAQSFGSVTAYLLAHSTVPLLVLQDLPEHDVHAARDLDATLAAPVLRASYPPGNV